MKLRNYFYAILCGLVLSSGFTACSDDDNDEVWNPTDQGSKIEIAKTRGFILNSGSMGLNNSHLNYFNYTNDSFEANDLFKTQNNKEIGDTGQDLIEYDNNLYLVVYGSMYIAKLNGVGVEQCRYAFNDELGKPRYAVGEDGFIYVTSYGGYVVKLKASDLSYVDKVQVGKNPEQIIEEDGYLYCVNSGWGDDNRLSIINEKTFTCENVEIMTNPQAIVESDGYIVIQGFGGKDSKNYPYPVQVYDRATKTVKEIGKGTSIDANEGILYVAYSKTDWTTYETTNTFYTYDLKTGKTNNAFFKNMPSELSTASIYGININDDTGHVYLLVTNYKSGDGMVYHFDNNGNYVGKFTSGGQNPIKIVFMD